MVIKKKNTRVNFYLAGENCNSLDVADNPFKLELVNTFA